MKKLFATLGFALVIAASAVCTARPNPRSIGF